MTKPGCWKFGGDCNSPISCSTFGNCQGVGKTNIKVIDSTRAKKALACIEELREMFLGQLPTDVREEMAVLAKYGFEKKK